MITFCQVWPYPKIGLSLRPNRSLITRICVPADHFTHLTIMEVFKRIIRLAFSPTLATKALRPNRIIPL